MFCTQGKDSLTKIFQCYPNVLIRQILESAINHMMTANHVSDQFSALFIGARSRPLSMFSAGHKREEKPLRHIAMVANFLDDNKSKCHLKSGFTLFQLHRS